MYIIELSGNDHRDIDELLTDIMADCDSVDDPDLPGKLVVYSHELPRTVRRETNEFRLNEPSGTCIISGFRVDDSRIGETPAHWNANPGTHGTTLREDLFLLLCGSLLGDPIAWATQQSGHLLHDVIPIKGHEHEQINSSTAAPLWWHTEDAFHPYRADYVGLMCLRNPSQAETTYAEFDDLSLAADVVQILSEPRYVIRPDESHLAKNRLAESSSTISADLAQQSHGSIETLARESAKTAILFGHPQSYYGRLDPYFMDHMDNDPLASHAFDTLVREIDSKIASVVLSPGDILFIDNYKAVHGRKPFTAQFDGRDRWLRRTNITRDLRKSRDARMQPASRVIL